MPGLFDPRLDPSMVEGDGLPLELPQAPRKANNMRDLLPLLVALPLALKQGGRIGGAALLRGLERERQQKQSQSRQDALDAENRTYRKASLDSLTESRNAAAQGRRDATAAAEEAKRQQFFQQFGQGVDELDDEASVQAYLALQQAKARGIGVTDDLSTMVPTKDVLSKRRAKKELEKLQKARPDDWQNWSVKVDGQEIRATDLAGIVRNPDAPPVAPKAEGGTDLSRALARYAAQKGKRVEDLSFQEEMEARKQIDATQRDPQRQPIVVTVGNSGLTGDQIRLAGGLRDDYRGQSKDFFTVRDAYERVQAAGANPTPAGDVALLYAFMKILDPGSVVRETEFATAAKTGSLPQQIQAAALRVVNGQRLTPAQRADFMSRAKNLYDKTQARQNARVAQFKDMAKRSGLPEDLVVVDEGAVKMPDPGGIR